MEIKTFKHPVYCKLTLDGRLNRNHYSLLRETVAALLEESPLNTVIDIGGLDAVEERLLLHLLPLLGNALLRGGVPLVLTIHAKELEQWLGRLHWREEVPLLAPRAQWKKVLLRRFPSRYDRAFFDMLLHEGLVDKRTLLRILEDVKRKKEAGAPADYADALLTYGVVSEDQLLLLQARHCGLLPAPPTGASSAGDTRTPPDAGEAEPERREEKKKTADVEGASSAPRRSEFVTRSLLGDILVELGLITSAQLKEVLEEQRGRLEKGEDEIKVGDLLIEKGYLTEEQIFTALEEQYRRRKAAALLEASGEEAGAGSSSAGRGGIPARRSEFVKPSLLGELLLEQGLIDESTLRIALEQQRSRPGKKLGTILLEMGAVRRDDLMRILARQQ